MAITTLFGINGVGKDTIAENLRKKNPEIRIQYSEQRRRIL